MNRLWVNGKFKKTSDKNGRPRETLPTMPYDGKIAKGVMDTFLIHKGTMHNYNAHMTRFAKHARGIDMDFNEWARQDTNRAFRIMIEGEEKEPHGMPNSPFRANVMMIRSTTNRNYHVVKITPYTPMPQDRDLSLCIYDEQRVDPDDIRYQVKHVDRTLHNSAMAHAKETGTDLAVLLNKNGNVTCVDRGNIFAKVSGSWITPPLSDGVMEGITRAQFMAEKQVEERSLTINDITGSDKILVTNSLMGVRKASLKL